MTKYIIDFLNYIFFISNKDVYSKSCYMQSSAEDIKKYKKREAKTKKEPITKKERAKGQRERITRCESPSSRPIKKGTSKERK